MKHRQKGYSIGETVVMLVAAALVIGMVVYAFRRSTAFGLAALGIGLGTAMLVMVFAVVREWRIAHQREKRVRTEMQRVAAERQAVLEATFFGEAHSSPAAFGVAGAARKLIHARDGFRRADVAVLEFDAIAAAFARPDRGRFRLEVRTGRAGDGRERESLYVTVSKRADAERWIRALAPHVGDRARFLAEPAGEDRRQP